MRNDQGKSTGTIVLAVLIIFIVLSGLFGGGGGPFGILVHFLRFFFWTGFILFLLVLAITAAVIWFTMKDNKYRGKHDPPNVTPKAARDLKKQAGKTSGDSGDTVKAPGTWSTAETNGPKAKTGPSAATQNYPTADRSKVYEKTPEGVLQMLSDYRVDYCLGQVAEDACKQKERLTKQQESYRRLVERRFGKGTLSAEKYLSVEKSSNDALYNSFLRITNRMEAFDTKEYMHFKSGAYKFDTIPDHVQEQRQEIYEENLRYMKECLADNEHILAGMDRLMLKLADSETSDEGSITEEIEELEKQLAYYRKQL